MKDHKFIKTFEYFETPINIGLGGYLDDLVDNCDLEIPKSEISHSENGQIHGLNITIFWRNKEDGMEYGNFVINQFEKLPDFDESSYIPHNDSAFDGGRFISHLHKSELIEMMRKDLNGVVKYCFYWRIAVLIDKYPKTKRYNDK
jgi:hypothetical protein